MDEKAATLAELFAGRFTVESKMDWGGLALIYAAQARGRELALAVPPLDCEDEANSALFHQFAEAAKTLDAPGVIPVLDAGIQLGVPFIAYERINAVPLSVELQRGKPMEPRRALMITRRVLEILQAAHDHGLVHGDMTPANILMDGDEPHLLGVGVAPILRETRPTDVTGPTGRGSGKGAVRYLAPEVLGGVKGSPEADIFSVGAVLQHMVTGAAPGLDIPHDAWDDIPLLREVIERATNRLPEDRYASAEALRDALRLDVLDPPQTFQAEAPPPLWQASSVRPPPRAPRGESILRYWWVPVGAIVIVAAAIAAFLVGSGDDGATIVVRHAEDVEPVPIARNDRPPPSQEQIEELEEREEAQNAEPPDLHFQLAPEPLSEPLPEILSDALSRVETGERYEEEDFRDLYAYDTRHPDDVRGKLVLGRVYMMNRWYTAAVDHYGRALETSEDAKHDPLILEHLVEAAQLGRDAVLTKSWHWIRRYYGREALPVIEHRLETATAWPQRRQLQRLATRISRLN